MLTITDWFSISRLWGVNLTVFCIYYQKEVSPDNHSNPLPRLDELILQVQFFFYVPEGSYSPILSFLPVFFKVFSTIVLCYSKN